MSTEVTPESLRADAAWLKGRGADAAHSLLLGWAARAEAEQQPLPTVPGWYPSIVVERGGESCTGALLNGECWETCQRVGGRRTHNSCEPGVTVRWAEQAGTTPGQTLYEAECGGEWSSYSKHGQAEYERAAAAVLAAHGTPTLTDEDRGCWSCSRCGRPSEQHTEGGVVSSCIYSPEWLSAPTLTPVGEHPEPGTSGLLWVTLMSDRRWHYYDGVGRYPIFCEADSTLGHIILADPRPDGAL